MGGNQNLTKGLIRTLTGSASRARNGNLGRALACFEFGAEDGYTEHGEEREEESDTGGEEIGRAHV